MKKEKSSDSVAIIGEIENQLEEILVKKKESIEKEVEERIKREKEEAQRKIQAIEEELNQEKQTLSTYRQLFAEYEQKKQEIKTQIKDHLAKAIELQSQIENMTAQTMTELKVVSELNQELEKIHHESLEKATSLKRTLEEKYGIVAELPENNGDTEVGIDLKRELVRLNKIKELLETNEVFLEPVADKGEARVEEQEGIEETAEPIPEQEKESPEAVQGEGEASASSEPQSKKEMVGPVESESGEEIKAEESEEKEISKEEKDSEAEVTEEEELKTPGQEEIPGEETETSQVEQPSTEIGLEDAYNLLEKYRQEEKIEGNGTVSFYEHQDKIIIDSEYLVSKMSDYVEEAKKLYIKLSQTESPREQFFVKQDIISFQEELRKMMLGVVELAERENCKFPQFTQETINKEVVKDVLERVTLGNWSNQEDFAAFDMYIRELKNVFTAILSPPEKYLESLYHELTAN